MTKRPVWQRRAAATLGAALLTYLIVWLAVPPLLLWQGEMRSSRALGRDVHIGRVTFTPWKLDLAFEDVRIAASADAPTPVSRAATPQGGSTPLQPPLATLRRLHLDFAWASLRERAPVIQALEVDGLRLHVARVAPGHYDIDDLLRRLTPKPEAGPSDPLYFALYNARLRDAALVFDDRPTAQVHALSAVDLAIPMLSNLPAQVDIQVEPRLSFVLNGVPFDSGALATPFAKTRSGDFKFKVTGFDVAPYLGYLPASLPVRVKAGRLTTDLAIRFAMPPNGAPTLRLQGSLTAADTELADSKGAPLLAWRRLDVDVRSLVPFARQAAISSLRIEGARLAARRNAAGTIDLPTLGAAPTVAPASAPRPAPSASGQAAALPAEWHVQLDRFALADAAVGWTDASVEPPASLRIDGLDAELERIEWPIVRPIGVHATGAVRADADRANADVGAFSVDGTASNRAASLKLSLVSLPLETLGAYLEPLLAPRVSGRLSAQSRLEWSAAALPGAGPLFTVDRGTIDGFALRERVALGAAEPPRELAALQRLALTDARVDVAGRALTVGLLVLDRPSASIARGGDGHWDVEGWKQSASPKRPGRTPPAPDAGAAPWRVLLREAVMTGGRFQWADAQPAGTTSAQPLRVAVDDLRVALQNLDWQGDRPTVPAQIALSGRVGPPRAPVEKVSQAGSFDWRGVVGIAPLRLTGSLRAERLPVHLFMPYVGANLPLRVARAEFGYLGNLSLQRSADGLDVDAGADLLLGAVRIETAAPAAAGETLLSWNTFELKSVRASMKPRRRPRIEIARAALDDFYARLLVTEEGKLNLSSVGAAEAKGAAPNASATAAPSRPPASAAIPAARSEWPFDLQLDATELTNGRIDFSDHFVRPNYSAALTELTGRLGALRSDGAEMAALTLRGKAAGTAVLDISGAVNPIARPLALDLHGRATDLELAPLSPYAGKYAGYAIERGKLSVDVSYRIGADGRLDAKNQVVLQQLTFGKKIDSPVATRLPVLLAVALLKDRNGVIDLNLPISGSLEDPQFSVTGIIGRLLGNLLVKAISSPFALLTGGADTSSAGSDPGQVEFLPGTTRLASAGVAAIDKVATALVDKPTLRLTVTGSVDPVAEQGAYRSAVLESRLEAVRRKETVASAAAASAPEAPLDAEAKGRLLKELYADSDLPDKPRNALGFARDIPAADMEARLKAVVPVDADTMRALALQRGVSVREALIEKGLPSARIFLAAPQVGSAETEAGAGGPPKAQLSLSVD